MWSCLLKVTKFLSKISQFEFLVITEKNIFAYKLFLSLNISDFNLFIIWQLQPPSPEKSHPLVPSNPPLKIEVLSSRPPFFKIWLEAQPTPNPQPPSGLLISTLGKVSWFLWTGLITMVLLMWKWMSLFLKKSHLLRCWCWPLLKH